jgi:hypothetical protein
MNEMKKHLLAIISSIGLLFHGATASQTNRSNILFFISDDLSWHSLGYGAALKTMKGKSP